MRVLKLGGLESSELRAGIAVIGGGVLSLFWCELFSQNFRHLEVPAIILAALGGIFMNINLRLANGSAYPY